MMLGMMLLVSFEASSKCLKCQGIIKPGTTFAFASFQNPYLVLISCLSIKLCLEGGTKFCTVESSIIYSFFILSTVSK